MRFLLPLLAAATLWADSYPRQPGIDVQHYVFRVTLSDDTDEIEGETTVTIRFLQPGIRQLTLDLGPAMKVSEVRGFPYRHDAEKLQISLNFDPKVGGKRDFLVKYRGKPASGLKILANKYQDRGFFSSNWPDLAHHWLPTIDHPSDKATGEFFITAPAHYQVVANGALEEQLDLPGDRRVTHWNQRVPIATWLYNIAVARFASRRFDNVAGVPLETWVYPQERDAGIATFEDASRRAVEFFSSHVGPFPYQKLANVQSAGNGGGMEHASAIFYGEKTVTGKPAYGLVAHETAHQWFGDSVTESDWDDVWLSEGFATYFAALATEHYDGRDALIATMKRSRDTVFTNEKRLPGVAVVQDKPWKGIPNGIVYQKGGWSLHMMRTEVGDDAFWNGIRQYYQRYRDGNATTADFRHVMEEASGKDLEWFFKQWLYRPGSPVVEGTWRYQNERVFIDLAQKQPGDPYRLPIEVAIGDKTERIVMTSKEQRFDLAAEPMPSAVVLDPNTRVLMEARFEKR